MVFLCWKNDTSLFCTLVLLLSLQRIESVVGDWNQIGNDIDGEAAGDTFGTSVAMSADGKIIAVGGASNDNGGNDAGHARVYRLNDVSEQYVQFGPDIDGKVSRKEFGASLAMAADGKTIAVGEILSSGSIQQLFRIDTMQSSVVTFQQIGSDILGGSLSMAADGNTFVVGANGDGFGVKAGNARVFRIDASPQGYIQIGPDLDGTAGGDLFGYSVAMSADGTTIAVGGLGGTGANGYVRVFKLDLNNNQYNQIGADILGEAPGDKFGYSLAMSADGSTVAVGARFNDGNGVNSGHVRVYKMNSPGQEYIQIGFDIDGEAIDDRSGVSVAISSDGTTIAVGAAFNDGNGDRAGHARVYKLDPAAGQYDQLGTDIDGERAGDQFGYSLDMSSDGTMIVVGAYLNNGSGVYSGHARVFRYSPVTTETPTTSPTETPTELPTAMPTILLEPTKAPVVCGFLCRWRRFLCQFFGLFC